MFSPFAQMRPPSSTVAALVSVLLLLLNVANGEQVCECLRMYPALPGGYYRYRLWGPAHVHQQWGRQAWVDTWVGRHYLERYPHFRVGRFLLGLLDSDGRVAI